MANQQQNYGNNFSTPSYYDRFNNDLKDVIGLWIDNKRTRDAKAFEEKKFAVNTAMANKKFELDKDIADTNISIAKSRALTEAMNLLTLNKIAMADHFSSALTATRDDYESSIKNDGRPPEWAIPGESKETSIDRRTRENFSPFMEQYIEPIEQSASNVNRIGTLYGNGSYTEITGVGDKLKKAYGILPEQPQQHTVAPVSAIPPITATIEPEQKASPISTVVQPTSSKIYNPNNFSGYVNDFVQGYISKGRASISNGIYSVSDFLRNLSNKHSDGSI